MIVEFIGCSGAGKTTLANELISPHRLSRPAVRAFDLVTDRPGLRGVEDPTVINLAADIVSFPSFLRVASRDSRFVRFAFDRLRRHAPTTFDKWNYMLNVVRRVGMHEMSRRAAVDRTVLVDEGVVLLAYHLFVYSDGVVDTADLDRFARLAPMPDRVVYVRAPLDLLVERAMRRTDRRRELVGRSRAEVRDCLARAVEMFDALVQSPPIRERLLTLEIADGSIEARDAAVRQVATAIETDRRQGRRVIAFVGSEASGKSTVVSAVEDWLGQERDVRRIHVGKPPSTLLTFVPHVLLPAFRALFPRQRLVRVETRPEREPSERRSFPPLFAARAVMLAYERSVLITRTLGRSSRDAIVLTDRYPSSTPGAPDGPQLSLAARNAGRLSATRWLATLEARLYARMPRPDLVFHLSAPLDVTLARNAAREKTEPERYVRARHALSATLRFDGSEVHRIDTDRDLDTVIADVKATIAEALAPAEARRA